MEEISLTIKTKPKHSPKPSWTAIGNGLENRFYKSYPYEEALMDFTANEDKMFGLILKGYNHSTGYSFVDLSHLSKSAQNKHSLGYKLLKQRGLVKRVKQKTYLINPTAKVHLSLFDELIKVWESIP